MKASVSLVILNWNSWKDTIECLTSLLKVTTEGISVVLVDNNSTDDSINRIYSWEKSISSNQNYIPKIYENISDTPQEKRKVLSIYLVRANRNYGFAEGCNIGIRIAIERKIDVICLLNNDTLVEPDFLKPILLAMEDEQVGVVGGKILYFSEPNRIWYAGGHVSLYGQGPGYVFDGINELDGPEWSQKKEVTFVTGCFMAVKRTVWETVGLIDPRFFFGAEDADFCQRVAKAGYKILFDPRSKILHKVARTYDKYSEKHIFHVYLGKLIFMRKHSSSIVWWTWLLAFCAYMFFVNPIRIVLNGRKVSQVRISSRAFVRALQVCITNFHQSEMLVEKSDSFNF